MRGGTKGLFNEERTIKLQLVHKVENKGDELEQNNRTV